jgi:hypothetical protein
MTSTNFHDGPTMAPPSEQSTSASDTGGITAPTMTDDQLAAIVVESAVGPTLMPPTTTGVAAVEGVTVTWHSSVQIDALWSIDQARNAFLHIVGIGWRKIYNGRDGAFQALVSLAAQARQTNRPASLREEADGMIYEIYVW